MRFREFREIDETKHERLMTRIYKSKANGFDPDARVVPATNTKTKSSVNEYDVDKRIVIK